MFALGIRYLRGVAVATDTGSYDRAEWPPHPARIFMALAAAHFETGADPEERAALEWLEATDSAPFITASDAFHRNVVTRFVPVNDRAGPSKALLQSAAGLTRDRAGRQFPTVRPHEETVFLIWNMEVPAWHTTPLQQLCDKVTRIGHSSSLVHMWVEQQPPAATWVPNDDALELRVRTLSPGLLRYLEESANMDRIREYAELERAASIAKGKRKSELRDELAARFPAGAPASLRPTVSTWQNYARAETAAAQREIAPSIWSPDFVVFRMTALEGSARELDLAATLKLTQRMHEAVLERASEPIPEYVSGHTAAGAPTDRPHLAYFPLAFVGRQHADGLIRGIGVALPRNLDASERRSALRAVGAVSELRMGGLGRWALEPEDRDPSPINLTATTWAGRASGEHVWATVTPIAFDRHPKGQDIDAYDRAMREIIGAACRHVRLPVPQSIVVTPLSAHWGAPAAHEFPRMRRKDGSDRRHLHAILVFAEPIRGPVMLGAGRYRGYGLCRPLHSEAHR